ncbi:MAG: hypothetical protein UR53_C0002G0020 [Candidatus Magasanikbacteria bacterium GW2011_GWC2_34_16]|uniref:Uncharacterized protein n=1 Tax=Candidatus Magasanikbacteria bacterium GW2011_GWC2_34_16 TaxID=1619045 RepID=A0A0G0B6R1_9BACT|nr:MAG: hypothetical protein UR53_C0002G0020 [Candidatus Magasanikbacteria bacterium GW2011_GWC2_34_16]
MEIKQAQNQASWDNWLKVNSQNTPFSQSFEWGEILLSEGEEIERLTVVEGENVAAEAQVVYKPLPFGWQYAFCPKGMVVSESRIENQESRIYETLINYLQNKKCIFFRVEPNHLSIIILTLAQPQF